MSRMQVLITVCALAAPVSGCYSDIQNAVKAYGVAADGIAASGESEIKDCKDLNSKTREASCDRATRNFQIIQKSAEQLKNSK